MDIDFDKPKALAETILKKCKELGCENPNETTELIGSATLIILHSIGNFLGCPFDEIREEYVRSLMAAELIKEKRTDYERTGENSN